MLLIFQMVPTPSVIPFAQANNAIMLAFFAIPLWNWSMTAIKISAALSLLRIKNSLRWKIFLYSIIAVQSMYCIAVTIFLFQICRPVSYPVGPGGGADQVVLSREHIADF